MFRVLFLLIAAIILYKLIFDFIIPIYRTSRQIKQKFRDMSRQANGFGQQQAPQQKPEPQKKPAQKDYIDFEEIK